jgi:pilus assembly protein Flp/PilA
MRSGAAGAPDTISKDTEMLAVLNNLRALARNERGVSALEYSLLAGLVAIAIFGSATPLGAALKATFTNIASALP